MQRYLLVYLVASGIVLDAARADLGRREKVEAPRRELSPYERWAREQTETLDHIKELRASGQTFNVMRDDPDPGFNRLMFQMIWLDTTDPDDPTTKEAIAFYKGQGAAFRDVWSKVEKKRAEIDAAVKKIGGRRDREARDLLASLVSETPMTSVRMVEKRAQTLLAADAELPALMLLAEMARDLDDPATLIDVTVSLKGRRRILDRDSEELYWMAAASSQGMRAKRPGFDGQVDADVWSILQGHDGDEMARGLFLSWPKYGLPHANLFDARSAPRGKWMLFPLLPERGVTIKVGGDSVSYVADIKYASYVNCVETDKVDGIDPVSGALIYRQRCDAATTKMKASLKATLAGPAPAWATGEDQRTFVVGRTQVKGSDWTVTDARIVDLEFMYPGHELPDEYNFWFSGERKRGD